MSSDTVISVENLSKRYLVGHNAPTERYHSLRDTIVRHGRNFARKTFDMARGRQIVQGDDVEEFWALKDVSFEVKRGEVLGVIGRNGAGKSTLLKILSRITEPSQGRVVLNGRVASLLEVGTGFHPELTGRENVFLNGAILGMSRAEIRSKYDEIVTFAEIEAFLDTPVKRYSSGMYVRLAFAVAAHLDPEILIVDEVLAVGDTEFQKKCLGKMQAVAGEGRTVLFVSHNLNAVERLCERGIVLSSGQLSFDGSSQHACMSYASAVRKWAINNRLDQCQSRTGDGAARIQKLEVQDCNGDEVTSIAAGEPIRVKFHLQLFTGRSNDLKFGFALLTESGARIFSSRSDDSNLTLSENCELKVVEVTIDGITLSPGHYLCNLAILDARNRYCDYLTEVPFLEITTSDKLPSGRSYDQTCGVLILTPNWKLTI